MDPDQGLRYELAAVLGRTEVLRAMVPVHPAVAVVPLGVAELAVLPVTAELADGVTPAALCALGLDAVPGGAPGAARDRTDLLTGRESGFAVLTEGVAALVAAGSVRGTLAYVEADYLGPDGRQSAAVWRAGMLVWGPMLLGCREPFDSRTAPISIALRDLGVVAAGQRDEFVVAGLGRLRRTADWADEGGG